MMCQSQGYQISAIVQGGNDLRSFKLPREWANFQYNPTNKKKQHTFIEVKSFNDRERR